MSEADKPIPPFDDEEDEATLAAIDEGHPRCPGGPRIFPRRNPEIPKQVDYRLLYTQRALSDLAEIIVYINEDDAESLLASGTLCSIKCRAGRIR